MSENTGLIELKPKSECRKEFIRRSRNPFHWNIKTRLVKFTKISIDTTSANIDGFNISGQFFHLYFDKDSRRHKKLFKKLTQQNLASLKDLWVYGEFYRTDRTMFLPAAMKNIYLDQKPACPHKKWNLDKRG